MTCASIRRARRDRPASATLRSSNLGHGSAGSRCVSPSGVAGLGRALAILFASIPNTGPAAITGDHATYMDGRAIDGWTAARLTSRHLQARTRSSWRDPVPADDPAAPRRSRSCRILWWLVPIAIVAAVDPRRPGLLGWTLILACMAVPSTFEHLADGNPVIWIAAFMALPRSTAGRPSWSHSSRLGAIHVVGHPTALVVAGIGDLGVLSRYLPPALDRLPHRPRKSRGPAGQPSVFHQPGSRAHDPLGRVGMSRAGTFLWNVELAIEHSGVGQPLPSRRS